MSDTLWFDRSPGDQVMLGAPEERGGDPTTLLMVAPEALPDWVRTPEEIGGHQLKVLRGFGQECPLCKDHVVVRHLECSEGFFVAECQTHGFAWYRRD